MLRFWQTIFLLLLMSAVSSAHVGSPDIYLEGEAGPYKLFVTIRPPQVIPGVAEIQVRSQTPGIGEIKAAPLPLSGSGASRAPLPDLLYRTSGDAQFFSGSLWLMTDGSWQVRLNAAGSLGRGTLAIPVPAIARTTRRMQWQLGAILSIIGVFLVGGLTAICGAAVREAKIPSGPLLNDGNRANGRIAMLVAFAVIALVLWGGKTWWDRDADVYRGRVYRPIAMQAHVENGKTLQLNLSEPGWMQPVQGRLTRTLFVRKLDDLVPDHNHLMHLYIIREPGMDVIYHLHPELVQPDEFQLALPAIPTGDYKLYADVVHENGLPETMTASLHLPAGIAESKPRPLSGDDASAETTPAGSKPLGDEFRFPDGYRMRWVHDARPLQARHGSDFRFELLSPDGGRPKDMSMYMGMLGHAAFVKDDGSVFAHVHPNGTVAMAALIMAQGSGSLDHGSMQMPADERALPNEVSFPYGLPTAGAYRIFVQMKHGETVETGVFDAIAK